MKISVDNQDVFTLSETQKKVIMNDIAEEEFENDMKRRLHYILTHKYEKCLERLRNEWMPKLKGRVPSIPTNDEAFAQLIFSQPEYKDRSQREREEKLKQDSSFKVQ